ncbi:MAG: CBS domain containing protein [Candidatus Methanohalarchaeum thermophilum]|uniref:CBS domain containing protein n=1 Tax=Methanohalarchaeum thermophilum TaxID=1903181 RepID=A0A1Q6DV81_METT1|nr:MAG: CBS domain containing protein [Candidatus Methanohalarchaeum thermophilum]
MKIKEIMNKDVITLRKDESIREAAKKLRKNNISGAPVLDDGSVVGIVSEADIIKAFREKDFSHELWLPTPFELIEIPIRELLEIREYKKLLKETGTEKIEDIMTENLYHVDPEDEIQEAAELMSKHEVNRVPVVKDDELIGIVAREDIISSMVGD